MYILLGDMYGTMFEEGALQAPEVTQAFQRWVCPAIRSPYINWMLHDATVTIQAIRPYGLGMFSGDLLEGSNRVPKDIWSVPFVNRPFESEIHGTVNFTQFCCVLLVTWCYRVLLSCYLRPK